MILNVYFDNATVYNFERLDVIVGEKFKVTCDMPDVRWFFDNDPVVSANVFAPNEATIEALEEGVTTVAFVRGNQIVHQFTITVVSSINLNPTVVSTDIK